MDAQGVIQEKNDMLNPPRSWVCRTLAILGLAGLLVSAGCRAPDKQMVYMEGQRALFRDPAFWKLAQNVGIAVGLEGQSLVHAAVQKPPG